MKSKKYKIKSEDINFDTPNDKNNKTIHKKLYMVVISIILIIVVAVGIVLSSKQENAITIYGEDLMSGVKARNTKLNETDESFINALTDFSIQLFKEGYTEGQNSLISPLSVYLSLAMTANGSEGETLKQFEEVLGKGISIDEINRYIGSLMKSLKGRELITVNSVNSIWFNGGLINPYKDFLQKNANYFGAGAYKLDFGNKEDSLNKINSWVSEQTDGGVKEILDEIYATDVMCLINTIMFDGKWLLDDFKEASPDHDIFFLSDRLGTTVEYMDTVVKYIEDENTTGFICEYKGDYSFIGLRPNDNLSVDEYIDTLTAEKFLNIINFGTDESCLASLPKFKYEYDMDLKDALFNMGLKDAFDDKIADFSSMGEVSGVDISYIRNVFHKTYIELNEEGTKCGSATVVMRYVSGGVYSERTVRLDRPFVYAIVDNHTKVPVFIGSITDPVNGVTYEITEDMIKEIENHQKYR